MCSWATAANVSQTIEPEKRGIFHYVQSIDPALCAAVLQFRFWGSPGAGNVPSTIGSCAGNQLPLSSKITANPAADYFIPLPSSSLTLDGNVYFNDGFYPEADNVIRQPSYAEIGAFVRWTAPGEHFSIRAFGKNLTDRRVINFEITIPNGTHSGFF